MKLPKIKDDKDGNVTVIVVPLCQILTVLQVLSTVVLYRFEATPGCEPCQSVKDMIQRNIEATENWMEA